MTITSTVFYPSKAARDAALKTGMKEGVSESFDRSGGLERVLRSAGGVRHQRAMSSEEEPVCPVCMAAVALVIAGATSTAGLTGIVAKKLRR